MESHEELQEQLGYETPEVQDLGSIEDETGNWWEFYNPDDVWTWFGWARV